MIGRRDLVTDPRFADNRRRLQHREELAAAIAAEIAKRSRADWIELGVRNKVPINPIHTIADAFADGQAQARGSVWNLPRPGDAALPVIASPLRHMSGTPAAPTTPPPGLGQHTRTVLQEVLKLGADEITTLKADGVIHCP
jgi:crotonobetainyl-CoA:carnitine CoA-transferase CaiB-like acyl-CoA transferase